jgi:hypothetical protein
MKRLVIVAACLALVAGCSKKPSDEAASGAPPAGQPGTAAQPAASAQPAGGPSEPAAPKKVEITEDMVLKYMEYQKENFALVAKYAEETKKNMDSAKGDTAKTIQQMAIADKLGKEMEAQQRAKRQALGLSEEDFKALQDAVQTVATGRLLYQQMGGDAQLAQMEAEQKKQIAALPADQREAASAQMAEVTKNLKSLKDGIDVREKYGDKSADVLLKHADALAKQYFDALKMTGDKK